MTNKEALEEEIKKRSKKSLIWGIIIAISILTGIYSITSIKNTNTGTIIFGISIILTIIGIITNKKYNKEIELIEKDIHDIEIIRMGNEDSKK